MRLPEAKDLAERLLNQYLPGKGWRFQFDRAKRRAGLCNHTHKFVSLSRYFVEVADEYAVEQVILHEIAHALAGPCVAHGREWLLIARQIGYVGGTTTEPYFPEELVTWLGSCPGGHEHKRFRRPRKSTSCAICSKNYDPRFEVIWKRNPNL